MLRAFSRATGANVAMMFGLAIIPLAIAVGAGLDFANAVMVRNQISDALDAAALAVGANRTSSNVNQLATDAFNANYKGAAAASITPNITNKSATLTGSANVNTSLLSLFGQTTLHVQVTNSAVWGQTKLWVALVLDNTGSMSETDSTGTSKMTALKSASHSLLTTLQSVSANAGDVEVAIVPFAKDVKVGTTYVNSSWIDWSDWNIQYPTSPANTDGPGSNCPLSDGCVKQPGSTTSTSTVPSSGTYSGYICPGSVNSSSAGQTGHYYDGCFTSVQNGTTTVSQVVSRGGNASCTGYSNCTCSNNKCTAQVAVPAYTHAWVINDHSVWAGCVMDRGPSTIPAGDTPANDYDTNSTAPNTSITTSLFPAENSDSCPVASVTTLSYDWTALSNAVDAMTPNGGTNQTIGLAHGMQVLTQGNPYSPPTLPNNTMRYIILLSDGLNTLDRWYGNGSAQSTSVDTRMAAACSNAKAQGFTIYTVFVDLGGTQGNSTVLQNCASDSSKYYDLTTSGAIVTTFNQIAQQITSLHLAS
ncbi:MAG TPA: pilus assembly protein [Rhizomicrobium sp.]|jgi:Flp pilus assembly protein TadG|nr:pilus assembly protein [Rhizomicrobium sp.]